MCNLYSMTKARAETARLGRALSDRNNNQPPMPGVYPDYPAPIILKGADGAREMRDVRWGMPSSKKALFDAASKRADKLRAKGQEVDFPQPIPSSSAATKGSPSFIDALVQPTYAKLIKAGEKSDDLVSVSGKGFFNVTAMPAQADRISHILSTLMAALRGQGWTVKSTRGGVPFEIDGEPLEIDIVEQTDRRPHVRTDKESEALARYVAAREKAARRVAGPLMIDLRYRNGTLCRAAA